MSASPTVDELAQLTQTIEMFEVITQSQPLDCQSLEILKEAYLKLKRDPDVLRTSRRIADAYVQLGQVSLAALEYESLLQLCPNDPEVAQALAALPGRSGNATEHASMAKAGANGTGKGKASALNGADQVDDGRNTMRALFVDGRQISLADFNLTWSPPEAAEPLQQPVEPFIVRLAEKQLLPLETSFKLVCEKASLAVLPIERYDVDVDLARSFPREICLRWAILPFDRMSTTVLVATANPFNRQAALELGQATKHRLLWYMAPPQDLLKALRRTFR
jgi:hypothetical protein